jgi:succinate dehydrogenase/fumarate reductase flavoprotein subunit
MNKKEDKNLSRRGFLAGAGTLAAAGAFGLGLGGCTSGDANGSNSNRNVSVDFAGSIEWATEYDVVVIGWGGAGSVSAITAADNGAKVLITEKAPYGDEGGNTRYCEQYALTPTSYEGGVAFMKAFAHGFDTATDEVVDFMVKGSMANVDWILSMGAESFGLPAANSSGGDKQVDWPPLEELETWTIERDGKLMLAGEWPIMPNGEPNDGVLPYQVEAPDNGKKKYWKLMRKNVVDRADKIDVWYESPAIKLIQDPFSKTIIGVQIDRKGQIINVRAKNGVVLSCGSYEASPEMYETYAMYPIAYPLGSTYNTGDGIRMGIDVGADLWHMNAISGPWITPKYANVNRGIFGGVMTQRIAVIPSCIYVGGNAKRFMKESDWHKHGHVNIGGTWVSQICPDICYAIMDKEARNGGGIIKLTPESEIIGADTIEELAQKIQLDPPTLKATVDRWNSDCNAGEDPLFGRPSVALKAFAESGPYYAVRLWPCCVNTQAGPRRNIRCEVLDTEGNPIPHLYSAGELGSFWAGVYQGGGNVSETMYTGREAGKNAAEDKGELESVVIAQVTSTPSALGNDLDESERSVEVSLGENEYLGTGQGLHGDVKVKATVVDGKVTAVEIIEHHETEDITKEVWDKLPKEIVAAGSPDDIDTISGATLASNGLKDAVKDAMSQA